jgi:hypothetical protein
MKALCLVLLLALSTPGCSRFSKSARTERAYYKHLKQATVAREKRRKQLLQHQRVPMPSLRNSPPPVQQETTEPAAENR